MTNHLFNHRNGAISNYSTEDGESMVISQEAPGSLEIDGVLVDGTVSTNHFCPFCNSPQIYHRPYDTHFCAMCNMWFDETCLDDDFNYTPPTDTPPITEITVGKSVGTLEYYGKGRTTDNKTTSNYGVEINLGEGLAKKVLRLQLLTDSEGAILDLHVDVQVDNFRRLDPAGGAISGDDKTNGGSFSYRKTHTADEAILEYSVTTHETHRQRKVIPEYSDSDW